jgi:hypothetical protein
MLKTQLERRRESGSTAHFLGGGAIEPLRPPSGFGGPPAYGITRNLMTG